MMSDFAYYQRGVLIAHNKDGLPASPFKTDKW